MSPTPNAIDPAIAPAVAEIRESRLVKLRLSNPPARKDPDRRAITPRFECEVPTEIREWLANPAGDWSPKGGD